MYSLKLVSHASVYFNFGGIKLLTDPWLFGECFNSGWKLLKTNSKDSLSDKEIQELNYIWISHEHPDHFHIPSLRYLASKIKNKKNVQIITKNDYKSQKEINPFLNSLGFKNIKLLNHLEPYNISKNISLKVYLHRHVDSALLIFHNKNPLIINMNDCELNKKECIYLKNRFGSFPLLLNQFSIAGYNGIVNNKELSNKKNLILSKMITHHLSLGASTTIPFASFCRFSNEDNNFLNKWHNSLDDVNKIFNKANLNLFCIKPPSNFIDLKDIINKRRLPEENIDFLKIDIEKSLESLEYVYLEKVILDRLNQLITISNKLIFNFVERYFYIFISDIQTFIEIDLRKLKIKRKQFDKRNLSYMEINSQPLAHAFKNSFGIQTLGISGRYKFKNFCNVPFNWRVLRMLSSLDNNHIPFRISTLFNISFYIYIFERRATILEQLLQSILRLFTI